MNREALVGPPRGNRRARWSRGITHPIRRWLRFALGHLRHDGVAVAFAFLWRTLIPRHFRTPRDPGERAAERFVRALGYRVVARNWRNPADRRDEADLLALSPDGRTLVIVEVKRASGPWDPLERVDSRKKEVLWRILLALERAAQESRPLRGFPALINGVDRIRVDLIGVEGRDRTCAVRSHVAGIFERGLQRSSRHYRR